MLCEWSELLESYQSAVIGSRDELFKWLDLTECLFVFSYDHLCSVKLERVTEFVIFFCTLSVRFALKCLLFCSALISNILHCHLVTCKSADTWCAFWKPLQNYLLHITDWYPGSENYALLVLLRLIIWIVKYVIFNTKVKQRFPGLGLYFVPVMFIYLFIFFFCMQYYRQWYSGCSVCIKSKADLYDYHLYLGAWNVYSLWETVLAVMMVIYLPFPNGCCQCTRAKSAGCPITLITGLLENISKADKFEGAFEILIFKQKHKQ